MVHEILPEKTGKTGKSAKNTFSQDPPEKSLKWLGHSCAGGFFSRLSTHPQKGGKKVLVELLLASV